RSIRRPATPPWLFCRRRPYRGSFDANLFTGDRHEANRLRRIVGFRHAAGGDGGGACRDGRPDFRTSGGRGGGEAAVPGAGEGHLRGGAPHARRARGERGGGGTGGRGRRGPAGDGPCTGAEL